MRHDVRTGIVAVLVVAVGVVIGLKPAAKHAPATGARAVPASPPGARLPCPLDPGGRKCIRRKMMVPILAKPGKEDTRRPEVRSFVVRENPDEARPCRIQLIPTRIFFDASDEEEDKERFRKQVLLERGYPPRSAAWWERLGAGRMMGDLGPYGDYAIAAMFFAWASIGSAFPPHALVRPGTGRGTERGTRRPFILGIVGPCTFAYRPPPA